MNYNLILKKNSLRTSLTVCLFVFLSQLFGVTNASGQNVKETNITYVIKKMPVGEAFAKLSQLTGFHFFYDESVLKGVNNLSVQLQNSSIDAILQEISGQTGLYFKRINNTISVSRKPSESVVSAVTTQTSKLTGRIIDRAGEPIIGANVQVKETKKGTITDVDGYFSLDAPVAGTLQISYIGYLTKELAISKERTIAVVLAEDTKTLDEVVVVGYGVVRKSDLTGSVSTMKSAAIESQPITSIDQALQGRIGGMQVTTASGAPGSASTIRIRGGNSINASNEPLYVIDGIIGGGDLSTINPSDIESVEVLRDASSTAIYGSRGANGVVMITTKRGKGSKGVQVRYNGYVGVQSAIKKLDLLNGQELAVYQNEYGKYTGKPNDVFPDMSKIADTNWYAESFKQAAITTDHNLSISKATEDGNYYLSLNYLNQDGLMYKSGFNRYQMRFNVDQQIGKVLQLGATMTVSYTDKANGQVGGLSYLPTAPVYNEDGSYFSVDQVSGNVYDNPRAIRDLVQNDITQLRALGNAYVQLSLFDGLVIKSTFGVDLNRSKQNIYKSVNLPTRVFSKSGGEAEVKTEFPISYQNENTINYMKRLGDHSFSALAGFTAQKYRYEKLNTKVSGFKNDATLYHAMQTGDPATRDIQTSESEWSMLSWLFRVNYSFKDRYMVTVSGRQDGSSRLALGNQWAFFPSAALAWRLSEEQFIKELNVFSNLKLRVSYGVSGTQSIDPYSVADRLQSSSTVMDNQEVIAFYPGSSANKSLSWEKTGQFDIGLDMGFFDNRLAFEIDYYQKKTTDLLLKRELAFQTGFKDILENIGSVGNKGFELTLNSVNIQRKDFTWNTMLTVSVNRNEVLDLAGKEFLDNGIGQRLIVGQPIGTFFGAKYLGTWKKGEIPEKWQNKYKPGDPRLDDLDDNGVINNLDGQILGNAEPKFYGGFGNDFSYKNFTLGLFFDFSVGNKIYDLAGRGMESGFNSNTYGHNRDRWSEANQDSDIPVAGSMFKYVYAGYAGGEFEGGCDYFLHDGSFFRLKNVNFEYKIPVAKKVFTSLSVYASATNLFTLTSYPGYSPDVNSTGTHATRRGFDSNVYPQTRTFTVGLKAQF